MKTRLKPTSRDAIIEAAFSVLNRDPSASLSRVAELAGVGRATLHRHFSSRDDLLKALTEIAVAEMDEAVDAACKTVTTHSEALRTSLNVLIPLGDRYGFLALEATTSDPDLEREFHRQRRETEEMIEGAKSERLFDEAVPTSWIVQTFDALLFAAWESVRAEELTPQQASNLAWRTFTRGLGGPFK